VPSLETSACAAITRPALAGPAKMGDTCSEGDDPEGLTARRAGRMSRAGRIEHVEAVASVTDGEWHGRLQGAGLVQGQQRDDLIHPGIRSPYHRGRAIFLSAWPGS
jgi:hypothetical protein